MEITIVPIPVMKALNTYFPLEDAPTAVLAMNNELAVGALRYLHSHSFQIPEDISFACYGNILNVDLFYVQPHYIDMDPRIIGTKVGELLIERIEHKNELPQPGNPFCSYFNRRKFCKAAFCKFLVLFAEIVAAFIQIILLEKTVFLTAITTLRKYGFIFLRNQFYHCSVAISLFYATALAGSCTPSGPDPPRRPLRGPRGWPIPPGTDPCAYRLL